MSENSGTSNALGPNEWLVDEMYEQYLADPKSVSASWQEFFEDYRRDQHEPVATVVTPATPAAPAVPAAPAAPEKSGSEKAAEAPAPASKPAVADEGQPLRGAA